MATNFDEALINRPTPWAACAALEEFFVGGARCSAGDKTNWLGIVFTCAMNADQGDPAAPKPELTIALGWAHLAISIRESLATGFSQEESVGIITGAMWVRAKMIARLGHHPGDHICDRDNLVRWCVTLPSVLRTIRITTIPPILDVDPQARGVAEILAYLVEEKRLEQNGDVGRLLDVIAKASQTPSKSGGHDSTIRAVPGEF